MGEDGLIWNVSIPKEVLFLVFWMGDKKTKGKCGVKTWTAFLAEIFFSLITPGNLGATGFERERERERERKKDGE